jgi:RNA polymerase sigma-70 factor (ECF subfamily)
MVTNPAEAEDLTQDAFLQVFRKIQTFRGESGFSTWLHRVTVNVVLMRFRRKKHAEISLDQPSDVSDGDRPIHLDPGQDDLGLTGAIDRVLLQRAVDRLPHGYKQMFALHDIEGYEHHEIASILGCSVGNSKSQLHKARLRLRTLLQEQVRGKKTGDASIVWIGQGRPVQVLARKERIRNPTPSKSHAELEWPPDISYWYGNIHRLTDFSTAYARYTFLIGRR